MPALQLASLPALMPWILLSIIAAAAMPFFMLSLRLPLLPYAFHTPGAFDIDILLRLIYATRADVSPP